MEKCALHGKEPVTWERMHYSSEIPLLVKGFILDNCGVQAQCFIDFEL